jgi:hypothetical protein
MKDSSTIHVEGLNKLVCEQWGLINQLSKVVSKILEDSIDSLFTQVKEDLGEESAGINYKYEPPKNGIFKIRASVELQDEGTIELGAIQAQIGRENDEVLCVWFTFMHPLKTLPNHSISEVRDMIRKNLKDQSCTWSGHNVNADIEHRNMMIESSIQPTSDNPVDDIIKDGVPRIINITDVFTWLLNSIRHKQALAREASESMAENI